VLRLMREDNLHCLRAGKPFEATCSPTNSGAQRFSAHELLEAFKHPQAAGVPRHWIQDALAIGRQAEAIKKEARPGHQSRASSPMSFTFSVARSRRRVSLEGSTDL
jgi:hypothetical protein